MPTTPEDFLPGTATLVLPSGKVIYVAEIGIHKVQLQQIAGVTWTYYNPTTQAVISTQVFPSGFITDPIDNSFVSGGVVYVEITGTAAIARAVLDHTSFDSAALEALPSQAQVYADAKAQSDEANTAAQGGLFYSLFGVSTTTGLIYTGLAVLGISYFSKKV